MVASIIILLSIIERDGFPYNIRCIVPWDLDSMHLYLISERELTEEMPTQLIKNWAVQEEVLIILFSHATITKWVKTIKIMPKFVFVKGAKFKTTCS